jgi:hypothetical protein
MVFEKANSPNELLKLWCENQNAKYYFPKEIWESVTKTPDNNGF